MGLLALSRSGSHPFDQDDSRVLTILSDQAAIALANVRLFRQLTEANLALSGNPNAKPGKPACTWKACWKRPMTSSLSSTTRGA